MREKNVAPKLKFFNIYKFNVFASYSIPITCNFENLPLFIIIFLEFFYYVFICNNYNNNKVAHVFTKRYII